MWLQGDDRSFHDGRHHEHDALVGSVVATPWPTAVRPMMATLSPRFADRATGPGRAPATALTPYFTPLKSWQMPSATPWLRVSPWMAHTDSF